MYIVQFLGDQMHISFCVGLNEDRIAGSMDQIRYQVTLELDPNCS